MFSGQKPHIFLILYLLKNIQPLKWFWNYKNLIQIRILKVRVSQLENTKLFYPFQELPSRPAHTKMHNSAILTFNQCPQTCYTTTSLVNWIIKLMLKYYGSVFLFCIHEEILPDQWLSPQNLPASLNDPHQNLTT